MTDISTLPIFCNLSPDEQAALQKQAEMLSYEAGKVLFYEGDTPTHLYILLDGECTQSFGETSYVNAPQNIPLDPVSTLGGLPHAIKITVTQSCQLLCWSLETLWASSEFNRAARHYLATALNTTQSRLNEVAAPIHYHPNSAALMSGPFIFDDTTLILAFCEADQDQVKACLPDGLSLLQRPAKSQAPIMIGMAKFPQAFYEHSPEKTFTYTETTYFIPVRRRIGWGLYIPHIYPSSWEPILLGREIYGLPKRLGNTHFEDNSIALNVDGEDYLTLEWQNRETASESRLVRGLSDWLGITGRVTEAAFQAGEVLRKMTRLPPSRGVNGYAHRQILAVDSDHENPTYTIDELTRFVFGILRWKQVDLLNNPSLLVLDGPFSDANLRLREAYRTRLDMRLSTGKVEIDYLQIQK